MIIYKATNKINGKFYVGYTTKTLPERISVHVKSSCSGSTYRFHEALRIFGVSNFSWEILEQNILDFKTLREREIFWIFKTGAFGTNFGYNMTPGGGGIFWTEDLKKKHSIILKKVMSSPDIRKKLCDIQQRFDVKNHKLVAMNSKSYKEKKRQKAAKLSWDIVSEIREKYSKKSFSLRKLAVLYQVHHSTIEDLVKNRTWIF